MNKVILIGRLARDPELRTTANNLSVSTFTIAVSRPFNPNVVNQEADFISCVVWRRAAENLVKYCKKGSQIAVEGRITSRNYVGQDGQRRYITEVQVDNLTFLGSRSDNQNIGNNTNSYQIPEPQAKPIAPTEALPIDNNYNVTNAGTTDITEDPFKDFGEEITLSDDDLPF